MKTKKKKGQAKWLLVGAAVIVAFYLVYKHGSTAGATAAAAQPMVVDQPAVGSDQASADSWPQQWLDAGSAPSGVQFSGDASGATTSGAAVSAFGSGGVNTPGYGTGVGLPASAATGSGGFVK
jgi:hypothetical protein